MKQIQITLTEYVAGKTVVVDEHPVVNDKDYCDVVETSAELHYTYNGINCSCKGNSKDTPKEELIQKIIPQTIFNVWFEENWTKSFSDLGLPSPEVYSFEEDITIEVKSIDDYYHNCKYDDNYQKVISKLQKIAESEYFALVIDEFSTILVI